MHKTLQRQLRRHLKTDTPPPEIRSLIEAVSESYEHYDERDRMTTRTLDVCSEELNEMNARLRDQINVVEAQRKKLEKTQSDLMAANQELKDFAYVVSHDLKAPLRAIGSLANWIKEDYGEKLDEDGCDSLDLLVARVLRMQGLIDGILAYSRVVRVRESLVSVDLDRELPLVVDSLAPGPQFSVLLQRPMPTVTAEKTRIVQVFQNLLSNAIKYNDKPRGQVRVEYEDSDDVLTFRIVDNGPGIDERFHERIFQIFQTLKPRDECEGTGIGLTVVRKVVELHGGRIWLESKVGEGTTFFFTLPRKVVMHEEVADEAEQDDPAG
mgnify:CR=1 FL=1